MIRYTGSHLSSSAQGFLAGLILMAIICDYNRNQMPIGIICLIVSVLCDIETD